MAAGWPLTQAAVAAAAAWKQVTERRRAAIPQNGPVALAAAAAAVEEEGPAAFFLPRCSPSSRQSFCEGHSCSRAGLDYHGIWLLAFRVMGNEMAPVLGKSNQEEEVRPQDNMAVGASVRVHVWELGDVCSSHVRAQTLVRDVTSLPSSRTPDSPSPTRDTREESIRVS